MPGSAAASAHYPGRVTSTSPSHPLLDALSATRDRGRRCDGHHAPGPGPDAGRLRRARGLQRDPQCHPAGHRPRGPPGLPRGRRRRHRDQHLRRQLGEPRRVRHSRADLRTCPRRRGAWPAPRRDEFSTADQPRFVLGSVGPGTKLPTLGHAPYRLLRDAYQQQAAGMLRGRRRRGPRGDLPGPAADQVGGHRRAAGDGRHRHQRSGDRARHRRDHRHHAARLRDRCGVDRAGAAAPRLHRAELRDRACRDERAPALPVPARAGGCVGDAERRPARARSRTARSTRCRRKSWRRRCSGFVSEFGLGLVGGCCGTTPEHLRQVVEAIREIQPGPPPAAREPGTVLALPGGAVPAGIVGPDDR